MTEIRPMTSADLDDVAAVHVRSWQTGYAGIVPAGYLDALDAAEIAERRRRQMTIPGGNLLVAIDEGRIIGFVTFGPYRDDENVILPDTGAIYALYVDPADWRRGAGRLLFEAARTGLVAAGFATMRLWVLEENHRARRFYERAGMAPDGARQSWTPRGSETELPELRYAIDL